MRLFKYILMLFSLPLCAEEFGPLRYELPALGLDWQILYQNDQTLIFVPNDREGQFFALNRNTIPTNLDDIEAIKKIYQMSYPDIDLDIKVVEKAEHCLILEWAGKVNGEEHLHGWSKTFAYPEETLMAVYQTTDVNLTEVIRSSIEHTLAQIRMQE